MGRNQFHFAALLLFIILILLSGNWYHDSSTNNYSLNFIAYNALTSINTMCLIGFGFAMTYLHKYGFTALSMTLLIISFSIPISLLMHNYVTGFFSDKGLNTNGFGSYELSQGVLGTITVLITYGIVLGRLNPTQIVCMLLLEIIFWQVNTYINNMIWGLHDAGFSINIHLFATYFGLAISYIIEHPIKIDDKKSIYHSDIFSLIGTLFLWIYWPSLNSFLVPTPYYFHDRAIVNTVLSLCGSTISAFIISYILTNNKFNIQHIEQSTLSGGVAIGIVCDLYIHPVGALSIGIISGIISVFASVYGSQYIENKLKISDTKGIHNVHGLPAIFGIISCVIVLVISQGRNIYVDPSHPDYPFVHDSLYFQAAFTVVSMCTTLLLSIFGGSVTGWIIVMFEFPQYEFKDTDNFNVFFEYLTDDPFTDTIRGIWFNSKRKKERLIENFNSSDDSNSNNININTTGDFNWSDDFDEEYEHKKLGIQVVDSNILQQLNNKNNQKNDWRKCIIETNIMPNIKLISYANVFRDYYFDDEEENGKEEEDEFYPSYCCAKILKQSFENDNKKSDDEYEYYLTAKLKSNFIPSDFKRKYLNLVIVLDIEGAISGDFEYECKNNSNILTEGNRNKEMSNILKLMINKQLTANDRIGITSGNKIIQNLQYANKIDLDYIEKEIIFLKNDKNEMISSQTAYALGIKVFKKFGVEYDEHYENRIIFITVGFSDNNKEFDAVKYAYDENLRIYTSVICIGIGLTNELNKRCRFRGCNIVNVSNANELKQYFNEINKFTYLVTPIFYNINLKLKCLNNNCQIDQIYGTKNEKYNKYVKKKGILQKIHTLFASNESIKIVKTGILLIKLISIDTKNNINATLSASYEDRNESEFVNEKSITFNNKNTKEEKGQYFDTNSIRKSILLCKYTQILINWCHENDNNNNKLYVNQKYKQIFTNFKKYFEQEMLKCNDNSLTKELDVLQKLSNM